MLDKIRRFGIIALIAVLLWALFSCKKQETPAPEVIYPTYAAEPVELEEKDESIKPQRLFSASDLSLPSGTIVKKDCANCGKDDQDATDNYVVIENKDGLLIIRSDINDDAFLVLQPGDGLR